MCVWGGGDCVCVLGWWVRMGVCDCGGGQGLTLGLLLLGCLERGLWSLLLGRAPGTESESPFQFDVVRRVNPTLALTLTQALALMLVDGTYYRDDAGGGEGGGVIVFLLRSPADHHQL